MVETQYYLIDLLDIIDKQREIDAKMRIEELQVMRAATGRMEKDEYKQFVGALVKTAGLDERNDKFDRAKFEQLRAMTGAGGNRTK